MMNSCQYCNGDNCWGHTNDEKSAMDHAKSAQKAALAYCDEIDALRSQLEEARKEGERLAGEVKAGDSVITKISEGIKRITEERDALRTEELRHELSRSQVLIEIADVLITNENAKEDWKNAKATRHM